VPTTLATIGEARVAISDGRLFVQTVADGEVVEDEIDVTALVGDYANPEKRRRRRRDDSE
jgi:hypothetical protein